MFNLFRYMAPLWGFQLTIIPALIAGAAALAGGAMAANSAKKNAANAASANSENLANSQEFNAQQAATARAFEAEQAQKQMDFQTVSNAKQMEFQERLSSTAHQREVLDLRAAGLNPILSGTGGMGSSTPVGSTSAGAMARGHSASSPSPNASPVAQVFDLLGPAVSSALNASNVMAELVRKQADTENIQADTKLKGAQELTEQFKPNAVVAQAAEAISSARYKDALSDLTPTQKDKLEAEIAREYSTIALQAVQKSLSSAQAGKVSEETRALVIDRYIRKQVGDLTSDDMPQAIKDFGIPTDLVKGLLLHMLRSTR